MITTEQRLQVWQEATLISDEGFRVRQQAFAEYGGRSQCYWLSLRRICNSDRPAGLPKSVEDYLLRWNLIALIIVQSVAVAFELANDAHFHVVAN